MKLKDLFESPLDGISVAGVSGPDFREKDIDFKEYEHARKRIEKYLRGSSVRLYRAVSVIGDVVTALSKKPVTGVSWTYDKSAARVYRDEHRGYGDTYILVAMVNDKNIDWETSLALNMIPTRGKFESEIRLKSGSTIKLINILDANGNKLPSPKLILKAR